MSMYERQLPSFTRIIQSVNKEDITLTLYTFVIHEALYLFRNIPLYWFWLVINS